MKRAELDGIVRETLLRRVPDATEREIALLVATWEQRAIDVRRHWRMGWLVGAVSMAAAVLGLIWLQR